MNAIPPRPARFRGRHAARSSPRATVGALALALLTAGGGGALTMHTAGHGHAGTAAPAATASATPDAVPRTTEPSTPSPSASSSVPATATPSPTATKAPTSLTVQGSVPISYRDFDEIYGGTACQGGHGGYLGFPGDYRMMSLGEGAPVIVTNGKGRKAGSGKLGRGVLSSDGTGCSMPFEVKVKLAGGGPFTFTIGTRCNDCDYPSTIVEKFTVRQFHDPLEVPTDHWA